MKTHPIAPLARPRRNRRTPFTYARGWPIINLRWRECRRIFVLEPQPSDQALSLHDSQALLSIARVLVPCRDIDELLRLLATELSRILVFDDLSLSVYDAGSGALRLRTSNHRDAPAHATPMEFNADGPAAA
jgi:hypothetical protein